MTQCVPKIKDAAQAAFMLIVAHHSAFHFSCFSNNGFQYLIIILEQISPFLLQQRKEFSVCNKSRFNYLGKSLPSGFDRKRDQHIRIRYHQQRLMEGA